MSRRNVLAAAALALAGSAVFAQTAATPVTTPTEPKYEKRNDAEHNRIAKGRNNGSLTKKEQMRLHAEQQHIKAVERHDAKDGVVTQKEQQHLDNMQDRASQDIYKQKHDEQGKVSTGGK
jgi:hypothetical protein